MIRIIFEQTGGIMGQRISLSLNLDDLPQAEAKSLKKLLDEADVFSLADSPASDSARDVIHYLIRIEADDAAHTLRTSDTSMPDRLRPLVQELSRLARQQRKG
ncbi:MAG: hypothetical protein HYU84_07965 [Chloroflexi bacterium]|nr:hypothetical protein [Chloroflexota bacterium]MBI3167310.1 hypothetical protein [Chloroflexota bacterium]